MSLRAPEAARSRPGRRPVPWLSWWVVPSASAAWRYPLLVALVALGAVYVFRGLVKMAFLFDASAVMSFVLAPLLLPLAALPAFFFYFAMRALPVLWQAPQMPNGRKLFGAMAALPAAWIAAIVVDVLEAIAILRLGIRLPRVPFDFF